MHSTEENTFSSTTDFSVKKTCFVLMPDNLAGEYENGHFKRVFDYLIKPACKLAGYADPVLMSEEISSQPIRLQQVTEIMEADLVICDLSTQHPKFLYQLGIRQALHLPVILLKDKRTPTVFDTHEWRHIEYDENLRVDIIESKVQEIAHAISSSLGKDKKSNALFAKPENGGVLPKMPKLSYDTSFIMDSINLLSQRIQSVETKINTPQTEPGNTEPDLSATENYSFIIRNK